MCLSKTQPVFSNYPVSKKTSKLAMRLEVFVHQCFRGIHHTISRSTIKSPICAVPTRVQPVSMISAVR